MTDKPIVLTAAQREVLRHLRDRPDATIKHRKRPGTVSPVIAAALERKGLATRFCDIEGRDQVIAGPDGREYVTDPGRIAATPAGRSLAHRAEPDQPVYLTTGGHLPFKQLPPAEPGAKGRWVVDDGIPAEHRGYSTAREYESDRGLIESRGHTLSASLAAPGDVERQDPDELHPHWRRDADRRHIDAHPRGRIADRIAGQLRAA